MHPSISTIGFLLLMSCALTYGFSLLLKQLFPGISGRVYAVFFHSFRGVHRSLVLLPIRILYFFYFPTEYKLRIGLRKSEYNPGKGLFGSNPFLFNRSLYKLTGIRFKNVKASITHSPASTFSIILAYFGFIMSIVLFWLSRTEMIHVQKMISPDNLMILSIACFILLLPLPYFLRLYILNLPVEAYASLIMSSLNDSEMIIFISYKIWRACNRFEGKTKWLHDAGLLIDALENKTYFSSGEFKLPTDNQKNKLKERIEFLQKNKRKLEAIKRVAKINNVELVRISTLMKYCAQRLNISGDKLCGHIFQFSPGLYDDWMKKFTDDLAHAMNTCDRILSHSAGPLTGHEQNYYNQIRKSLYECNNFYTRNTSFQRYQVQHIAYSDLHDNILAYASQPSGCEAVKAYIKTISEISQEIKDFDTCSDRNKKYYAEKFAFAFHKRKTHNGLDLHYSAYRLLQNIVLTSGYIDARINKEYESLLSTFETANFGQFLKRAENNKPSNGHLDLLARLYSYSIAYIDDCHEKIRSKFIEKYQKFFSVSPEQHLYVAMFGFSRTVIDIIKVAIPGIIDHLAADPAYPGRSHLQERIKIAVFVSEDESREESAKIKYCLTEERQRSDLHLEVLIRSQDSLLSMMDNNSKLLVLLGTEAYDCQDRILGTNPCKMSLKDFIGEAKKRMWAVDLNANNPLSPASNIKVVACAESYKGNEDLRAIEVHFGDHYDRVQMYEAGLISEIISDELWVPGLDLPNATASYRPL